MRFMTQHSRNGILNIDKPAGMTSHDVVARVRRLARIKRVGHAGTLDPDATGVLLVCLGTATRLAEYLAAAGKAYRATLALGATTTTEDASGNVLTRADASGVGEPTLRAVLPRFVGEIEQTPPMVSAVHHEGRRLYELAREGITVERSARTISVGRIDLRGLHTRRSGTGDSRHRVRQGNLCPNALRGHRGCPGGRRSHGCAAPHPCRRVWDRRVGPAGGAD